MQICFIGGGNHLSEEFEGVLNQLKHFVKPSHNVLLIPFATEPNKYLGWYNTIKQTFELLDNNKVEILTYDMSPKEMISKINKQDILYFYWRKTRKPNRATT